MQQINFDIHAIKTPYYIVDESLLERNLAVLRSVKEQTGCKILLAQKAFSMFSLYENIRESLDGTCASGLYEAKLGREQFGKETHVFSAAYAEEDMDELLALCGHMIFNSFAQWERYKEKAMAAGKECGIRINPECSTGSHGIYDPCAPFSRLGVTKAQFRDDLLDGISGLHFHTLCEQNSDDLATTLAVVEEKFGSCLKKMKWVNFGGGHHITRSDYDIALLVKTVNAFQEKYGVQVYLEPGEAVALNTGFLVTSVLDIIENGMNIAILDASAACHMPDVLEMPYRPNIIGAKQQGEKKHTYRLAGMTCLAGDVIGDYAFDTPLKPGDKLVFCDMAHYSMVKNNTFNGMKLPSIAIARQNGQVELVKKFSYENFKSRLS